MFSPHTKRGPRCEAMAVLMRLMVVINFLDDGNPVTETENSHVRTKPKNRIYLVSGEGVGIEIIFTFRWGRLARRRRFL